MNAVQASPNAIESERALLGACLLDPGCIDRVLTEPETRLSPGDFYHAVNGRLWALLCRWRYAQKHIDPVTVGTHVLTSTDFVEADYGYVVALPDKAPSRANPGHYARNVKAAATSRAVLRLLDDAREQVRSGQTPEALQSLMTEAGRLLEGATEGRLVTRSELIEKTLDLAKQDDTTGLAPPWPQVADIWPRMKPGQLAIIGAPTGVGKSLLGRHLVRWFVHNGYGCLTFGLEMDPEEMLLREVADRSSVSMSVLQQGIRDEDGATWGKLYDGVYNHMGPEYEQADLDVFYDGFDLDVQTMEAQIAVWAQGLQRRGIRPGAVLLDYVQIANTPGEDSRYRELSAFSRRFKVAAKKHRFTALCVSQLTMPKGKAEPNLEDVRESKGLTQDADAVMLAWRPGHKDETQDDRLLRLKFDKGRACRWGTADLEFDGAYQRIGNPIGREW